MLLCPLAPDNYKVTACMFGRLYNINIVMQARLHNTSSDKNIEPVVIQSGFTSSDGRMYFN